MSMGGWGLRAHAVMAAVLPLFLLAPGASAGTRLGETAAVARDGVAAGNPDAPPSSDRRALGEIGRDPVGQATGSGNKVGLTSAVEGAADLDDAVGAVDGLVGDTTLRTDGAIGDLAGTDPDPSDGSEPSPDPSPGTEGGADDSAGIEDVSRSGTASTSDTSSTGAGGPTQHMTPAGSREIATSGLTHGALQLARPLAPAVAVALIGLLLLAAAARGNDRLVKRDADGSRAGAWRL